MSMEIRFIDISEGCVDWIDTIGFMHTSSQRVYLPEMRAVKNGNGLASPGGLKIYAVENEDKNR